MASSSFTLTKSTSNSSGSYIIGKIAWSATANAEGNYSSVTATIYCKKANDDTTLTVPTNGTWKYSISINGKVLTGAVNNKNVLTDWVAIGSYTLSKVAHDIDGSKKITIEGSVEAPSETSFAGLVTSGSKSISLDSIQRISTVTATNANIGSKTTITISRVSSSLTNTLTYDFGTLTGTIATKTTSTSVSWTVPTAFYNQIPTAKSGKCTITCTTYSGSTFVGTSTCTFTATAKESICKPTLFPTYVDANATTVALTGDNKKFVRYFSTADLASGAEARNGATLKSQTIACVGTQGGSMSGSSSNTSSGGTGNTGGTATFRNIESATFEFSATDSRGYTTKQTVKATLVNYVKPTCVLTKTKTTVDGSVTFTVSGNFFNGSFGKVTNALTLQYRYKVSGGSYGSKVTLTDVTLSGNKYTASFTINGLDYKTAYTFQAFASDSLTSAQSSTKTIKFQPVFDWGENDFRFNVPIYSGGVNFTTLYQTASGASGLGQGESATILAPTDYHRFYYVRPTISNGVSAANVYIPCCRIGDKLIGMGGFPHSDGDRIDIFSVQLLLEGDKVTVEYCGYWNTKTQAYSQRKVNGIFAVL